MHTGKQCLTLGAVKKMAKCTRAIGMRSSLNQQVGNRTGMMIDALLRAGIVVTVGLADDLVEAATLIALGAFKHFLELAQPARVSFNVRLRPRGVVALHDNDLYALASAR